MRTTSATPRGGRRFNSRWLTRPIAALLVAGLAIIGALGAIVASAAVPTFPDNLVVFPDRDFISVEGFQGHKGETATVEIKRGATVMGSARAVVSGEDVAFEINHPGGYCWGAGTALKVTPDIRPGDVASIRFGDAPVGQTTVQDAMVTSDAVLQGSTVTVTGHIGAGVDPANTEQRIIEPALTDTT